MSHAAESLTRSPTGYRGMGCASKAASRARCSMSSACSTVTMGLTKNDPTLLGWDRRNR